MKTAKRFAAIILAFVLLLTNEGVAAFAEAVFTLPVALKIIEEEAFYGSTSLERVVLPNRVTEIRARAFANSTLSEINLPDSITYIAEDAFDGPDKVTISANKGTYAYRWAVEHRYITEGAEAIDLSVSPDMLTLAVGSTYQLSCALVPSDLTTVSVAWRSSDEAVASVAQGTITAKAEGTAVITATSANGLTATCEVKVTRSVPAPVVTSAAQDGMGAVTLFWNDLGSDCEYMVYEQVDDALALLGSTAKPTYTVYAASAGVHSYCVQAAVRDQDGSRVSSEESSAYDVDVRFIWRFSASIESVEQASVDSARITWRGVSPVSYYEIAEITGAGYEIVADQLTGDTAFIQQVTAGAHRYAIRAVYLDQDNQTWTSDWSSTSAIAMLPADAFAPAAPILVFGEPEMAFSAEEAAAPEYDRGSIEVAWLPNEYAQSYAFTVEKKTASGYTLIAEESDIATTAHSLSASLFADVTERTLYRFGICSQGETSGEYAYSYFAVTVPDTSISVSSKRWERTSKYAGTRVFTVTSELPWTATTDAEWMTLVQDEATLEVRLSEYSQMGSAARTATITLTNGENTASITVVQGRASDAPVLSLFGQALSTDINNPTEIPAGSFSLGIDDNGAKQVLMRFAQKTNGSYGGWQQKQITNKTFVVIPYEWNAVTFSAGKEFCIEASGHYSSTTSLYGRYEIEGDAPTTRYYIKLVDQGHYLLIEGQEKYELTVYDSESVDVLSSNSWSAVSDSSWLTFASSKETDVRRQHLSITAEENYTGSERTGHITIACGSSNASITVHQPDLTPRVISPANLSQTESAPTSVGAGTFFYTAIGYKLTWEYKNGAVWVNPLDGPLYVTSDKIDTVEGYIESDLFDAGKTYRLTVMDTSGRTAAYYLKRSSTTSTYIQLGLEEYRSFNKPAGASTETVTLKSSGSWSVTSDASWLTASPTSGKSGSGQKVTVSVAANTTAAERIGVLSFKIGSTVYAKLKMTQAAAGTDYVDVFVDNIPVARTNALNHVTGAGVILDIRPYAPGKITAASSAAWLTVKDEISSGASANVKVAENDSGARRSGTITFSYGTASKTITMTQEPYLSSVTLTSPSLSTDDAAPTVLTYSDSPITMKWNGVANAVRYYVELWKGNEYHDLVVENAGATNTATLPADWFDPAYTGQYELVIWPIDAYGNDGADQWYYFTRAVGNAVYINGKTAASWNDVTDLGKTAEYTVASGAAWTASADASWISLGAASGANGDVLSVTAARNPGAARTGKVTVKSGSATAVLTVKQCAVLPEFPRLKTPNFSEDIANPAIWVKADKLTVAWDVEPQAERYSVYLGSVTNSSTVHIIERSVAEKGTYSFDTRELVEGQTYVINLRRTAENADGKVKSTSTCYYFAIAPALPFISIDSVDATEMDESERTFWADGAEDHIWYTIASSGTWTATVSDSSWLMVAKTVKDAAYLAENEKESADYEQYTGNSGDSLCISVLDNNTGNTRYGTVTITTAGASTTLFVEQEQHYVLPEITSPTLATKPSASAEMPYGSIALQWTAGENNTGVYNVTLYEKEDRSYYKIYQKKEITKRLLTIPPSELKENTSYRLYLDTTLENSGETAGQYYYFNTGSANALIVSATVDWSQVDNGGDVDVSASASGGAGDYRYAYQLLLDGAVEQETEWTALKRYQFKPWSNGNYQVKVFVKDAAGKQVAYLSDGYEKEDARTISVATANHYAASLDSNYQFLEYAVLAPRTWSIASCPDWITPSVTGVTSFENVRLIVAKNDGVNRIGKVEFRSNAGVVSDLTITQSGSRSVAMVATEETVTSEAQSVSVSFAAAGRWTASSDSSWATLGAKTGSSGNRTVTVNVAENTGAAERSATISVISNGDLGEYTIRQLGKAIEQNDLKLSETSWLLPSMAAATRTFTVTASGSWRISAIPDWMSANVSSGEGSGDISLYCSSNPDQSARSGIVTIASGSLTQSIHVSQPGNDVLASVVAFTMSKSTVETGDAVEFTVKTRNADQVQLIVDDVAYNQYSVLNDQVTFTRAFSLGGTRKVAIMPIRSGENGLISDAQYLTVNSNGKLDAPSFTVTPDNDYVGVAAEILILQVAHADTYTIRVYAPNSALIVDAFQVSESELADSNRSVTIAAEKLLVEGVYAVNVMASGQGYSQSESGSTFVRNARNYSISFATPKDGAEFVPGDTIYATINQTGGGYASIKVVPPNGEPKWYPESGNCTTTDASYTAYIPVEESGVYSIYGYVYAIDLPAAQNVSQKEAHIVAKAKGPEISKVNVAEYKKTYTWIYQATNTQLYITTNNAVEQITLTDSRGGTPVSETTYSNDGWNRLFVASIPDNSAGAHMIQITALDEETGRSTTSSVSFYIAAPVSNYTAYATADTTMVSSPMNGTKVADVAGGAYFEPVTVTHNAGDWVGVSNHLGNVGFIRASELSQSAPTNASGTVEIVSPSANATLPRSADNTVSIRWRSGVALTQPVNVSATFENKMTGIKYASTSNTLFNSVFDVSYIPDGVYSVRLTILGANTPMPINTNAVEITLGGYSDEAYYKEWFEKEIYPFYAAYMELPVLQGAVRAKDFFRDGIISDGDHLWRALNNEGRSNYWTLDETERKQVALTVVSNIVLEDEAKAENKLKADMSNVSNVVATQQNNAIVSAEYETLFSAVSSAWAAICTTVKTAALINQVETGISSDEAMEIADGIDKVVNRIIEIMESQIMDLITRYNSEALIEAYKKEYATAMKKACQEYVDYLEITLFGEIGGSRGTNINTLDFRQQAALTYIKAYRQYMNNPTQMQDDAVETLLSFCSSDITMEQIKRDGVSLSKALQDKFSDIDTFGMLLEQMVDYLLEDVADYIFERLKPAPSLTKEEFVSVVREWGTSLFKWDTETHKPVFDWEGLVSQMEADGQKYGFSISLAYFMSVLAETSTNKAVDWKKMMNYVEGSLQIPEFVKKNQKIVQNGILKAAFSVCESAWKTGIEIAGLIDDMVELESQKHGRSAFDMYGMYLSEAFSLRIKCIAESDLTEYRGGWSFLSELNNIHELEQKRAGLITLMNTDVDLLTYYRNMRRVNENAGWRFRMIMRDKNDKEVDRYWQSDYSSYEIIDSRIAMINTYKGLMTDIPSDIQKIIDKYQ